MLTDRERDQAIKEGHDPDKSITLTCQGQRDITIHPLGQQKGE